MSAPHSEIATEHLEALCELAESVRDVPGCFVEVGVYKGGSAFHLARIAQEQGREIYLYDTFAGLPFEDNVDTGTWLGELADTSFEEVQAAIPYATIIKGIFPYTLVPMPPIAFAHIDVDQYRSTQYACMALGPKVATGGIMYFDDYGVLLGATLAIDETGWALQKTATGKAFWIQGGATHNDCMRP